MCSSNVSTWTFCLRKNMIFFPYKAVYNRGVPYLLSRDEGTTSARTALYNERGKRIAMESAPIPCTFPHPGWVEQDADLIWRSQLDSAHRVLGESKRKIEALGITNQRETTIV